MNRYEFYGNINTYRKNQTNKENELTHYGTLGQKWGVRKWQNPDGTFNEAGKKRYFGKNGTTKKNTEEDKIGNKDIPTVADKLYPNKKYELNDKDYNKFQEITYDISSKMEENAKNNKGQKFRENQEKLEEELLKVPFVKKHFDEMKKIYQETGDWDKAEEHYWEIPDLAEQGDFLINTIQNHINDDQKIGASYKMSPWEKKAEKNRLKDLKDDYKNNKKNMTKDEFEKWKETTENKEKQRKIDKKEFADIQELKENIAKGKKISEKEYDKLSEEGKKIYNASQEMKENGWDVESKKDNPNSKYIQRVDLLFTKKLDNKDFGDKFTVYQKDLNDIKDLDNKATKAMNFLNKKDSYDKIVNNLLNEQYEIYKDVTKRENRKNIMSKSEFFEREKPYVKEVGFDTWGGGDGSIGIDFEPKNPNTSWFGYGFEVWVDPNTGKIIDYYQS